MPSPRGNLQGLRKRLGVQAAREAFYNFDIWAWPHQVPPEGDWTTWLLMGGRGAGKTRAGAECSQPRA
jgi:phage terminase large subunit-like protein